MSKNYPVIEKDLIEGLRHLHQADPEVMKAFAKVSMEAKRTEVLDTRTKEL